MRDGVGTAFLAGLFLVGVLEAGDDPVDRTKIAVKFAIGLVLLVLVMANLRKEWIPTGLYWALLVLTLANVGVALVSDAEEHRFVRVAEPEHKRRESADECAWLGAWLGGGRT